MNTSASSTASPTLTQRPQWQALLHHAHSHANDRLRDLFAADAARGDRMNAEAAGLYLD
jgi:glucose-6-phosphate isomerase